jgi:hypothetical protein
MHKLGIKYDLLSCGIVLRILVGTTGYNRNCKNGNDKKVQKEANGLSGFHNLAAY